MTNIKRAILAFITAVVATLGFSVGLASAHNKAVTPSCSGLAVSLTQYADDNNAGHKNTYSVTIDGSVAASSADFGTTYVHTFTWDQYADHTYTVVVTAYDGAQYGLNVSGSQTHCKTNPPKPEVKVTYTDWVGGQAECGQATLVQTRTKTVTDWTLVNHVWVAGTPVVTTETRTIEIRVTPCEPHKEPKIVTVDTGTPVCGDTTVTTQTTTTTYTYTYDSETNTWAEHETVVVTTGTRAIEATTCPTTPPTTVPPTTVPPTTVPPTTVPPVLCDYNPAILASDAACVPPTVPPTTVAVTTPPVPASPTLPVTGGSSTTGLLIAGIMVLVGSITLVAVRRKPRQI